MSRRSDLDIVGQWLLFVAIPGLVTAPLRMIRWCWRVMRGKPRRRRLPGMEPGFYRSRRWQTARIKCFERNKAANGGQLRCELCGRAEEHGVIAWHCHHIKSRSKWPELALDQNNLAACCDDCNMGMSNRYDSLDLTLCKRRKTA